uniref:Transposase n=1 Tax=Acrobeloides nanus TaxID=290746 RepID=A0A914CEU3_9BILA
MKFLKANQTFPQGTVQSTGLKRRFAGGRHWLILFIDEKWFDIEQSHNHQNDRQWSEEPLALEERIVERTQKPTQVMVWAGVGHRVKTPLFFVEMGIKVNGDVYRDFLRTKVLPWARRTYRGQHWVWQEDGAPQGHRHSGLGQEHLPGGHRRRHQPPKRQRRVATEFTTPDLNVMDYSIWSILEAEACAKPHQSIETLKKSLVAAWNKIPQDMIDRAVDDFPKRLKKCIDAEGGHFENKYRIISNRRTVSNRRTP